MASTRRNSIYYPTLAKNYVDDIKVIRMLLRIKRDEYKLAEHRNDPALMNQRKMEFDEIWKKRWPYYTGIDRVPYSPHAMPYPSDAVLIKINPKARWQIIATALLARRGVDKRRHLEGLIPKINSMFDTNEFKWAIRTYINPTLYEMPPSYPRGSSEYDDEEEWEEWDEADHPTPPANPFPHRRPNYRQRRARGAYDRTPEGSPHIEEGTAAAPAYEVSHANYELEGGRTRKRSNHKRSNHKRTKHKRTKHKRTKHKRSNHKRSNHTKRRKI